MNNITRTITSFLSMTIVLTGLMISPVYAEETVADDWIPLSTNEEESKDLEEPNDVAESQVFAINNINELAAALGTDSVTILSGTDLSLKNNIICSVDKALYINSGVYNIDFNGFTISDEFIMKIFGGNVTFKDSSAAQTGGIDTINSSFVYLFLVQGGNLTILSGLYKASNSAVEVRSGSFTLKGGTLESQEFITLMISNVIDTTATINIVSGSIRSYDESESAVYIRDGALNMSGGLIESWEGIDLYEGAVATISGCDINSRKYGITLDNGSACTITGGSIVAEMHALYVSDATLSISGGEFFGKFSGLLCVPSCPERIVSLSGGKFSSDPSLQGVGVMAASLYSEGTESVETYLSSGYMFIPSTITEGVWDYTTPVYSYSHTASTVNVVSGKSVEGFVNRLYTKALERSPDPTGFADWVSQLKVKQISGAQAAYGFFFSPEIINRNLPDSDFIKLLYNVFFDREPDATGLSYWLSAFESGASRKYVFAGFANSQEWKSLCGTYAIDPGSYNSDEARDQNIKVTSFVQRLYTLCLNRKADVPGLNDWTAALNSKQKDGAHVAYGFFFSPEFKNQNLSNENYVEILYQVLLGRASDSAGKADWVAQLKAGKDRLDVFRGFVHSKEFDAICASYGITRGTI